MIVGGRFQTAQGQVVRLGQTIDLSLTVVSAALGRLHSSALYTFRSAEVWQLCVTLCASEAGARQLLQQADDRSRSKNGRRLSQLSSSNSSGYLAAS
jgi:hypothetical protein